MKLDKLHDVVENVDDILGGLEVVAADVEACPVFKCRKLETKKNEISQTQLRHHSSRTNLQ